MVPSMPGESILVIDDSPTILKVVQLVLTKAGYMVNTAADGDIGRRRREGTQARPHPPRFRDAEDERLPGLPGAGRGGRAQGSARGPHERQGRPDRRALRQGDGHRRLHHQAVLARGHHRGRRPHHRQVQARDAAAEPAPDLLAPRRAEVPAPEAARRRRRRRRRGAGPPAGARRAARGHRARHGRQGRRRAGRRSHARGPTRSTRRSSSALNDATLEEPGRQLHTARPELRRRRGRTSR